MKLLLLWRRVVAMPFPPSHWFRWAGKELLHKPHEHSMATSVEEAAAAEMEQQLLNLLSSASYYPPPHKPPTPRASQARRPVSVQSQRANAIIPVPPSAASRPNTGQRLSTTPMPLIGAQYQSLPTERAGARKLQAALLAAFDRSP